MRNTILNLSCNEDGIVSIDNVTDIGSWDYLTFMMDSDAVSKSNFELEATVDLFEKEATAYIQDETDMNLVKTCCLQFKKHIQNLIDEGNYTIVIKQWSVEYDRNVGVLLSLD